jgi:hypothetical protein
MALFEFHIHVDNTETEKKLNKIHSHLDYIIKQNLEIMSALSDLKDKLALSDQKLDVLTTATDGLTDDIAHLKELLANNPDGIDAAGVAELNSIVDAQQAKLTETAQKMADLDSQTERPTPEEPTEPEA